MRFDYPLLFESGVLTLANCQEPILINGDDGLYPWIIVAPRFII